jgi:hypothetical protein
MSVESEDWYSASCCCCAGWPDQPLHLLYYVRHAHSQAAAASLAAGIVLDDASLSSLKKLGQLLSAIQLQTLKLCPTTCSYVLHPT